MLARADAAGLDQMPAFAQALEQVMEDWIYEQAFARLVAVLPAQQDTQDYLKTHAAALRAQHSVQVYADVLAALRLIPNASS
jgi:hypothetical protein